MVAGRVGREVGRWEVLPSSPPPYLPTTPLPVHRLSRPLIARLHFRPISPPAAAGAALSFVEEINPMRAAVQGLWPELEWIEEPALR